MALDGPKLLGRGDGADEVKVVFIVGGLDGVACVADQIPK